MFWRLKTQIPSIPSKQPWNGLLSSYIKVSQISYPILWFFSCISITLPLQKSYINSQRYQAMGSLIKLFLGKEQINTGVCMWNTSLASLYLQNPHPWLGSLFLMLLALSSSSLRIKITASSDLPWLFRHKHNKIPFFSLDVTWRFVLWARIEGECSDLVTRQKIWKMPSQTSAATRRQSFETQTD